MTTFDLLTCVPAVQELTALLCPLQEVAGSLLSLQLLLQDLESSCAGEMAVTSQPVLALAAVYCNSMELFMMGSSFAIGKLCCCTSVRNKDMQWVNKHIRVNPNKQK